jgi:hypothetical protein
MSPFGHVVVRYVVSTRYEGHGVEHRPKVTENGHMKRGNPSSTLSDGGEASLLQGFCRFRRVIEAPEVILLPLRRQWNGALGKSFL